MAGITLVLSMRFSFFCAGAVSSVRGLCGLLVIFSASSMVIGSDGNSVLPDLNLINLMHVFCLKLHVSCYDTFIVNMQVLLFFASPGCIGNYECL